jgi:hypothetical protein
MPSRLSNQGRSKAWFSKAMKKWIFEEKSGEMKCE